MILPTNPPTRPSNSKYMQMRGYWRWGCNIIRVSRDVRAAGPSLAAKCEDGWEIYQWGYDWWCAPSSATRRSGDGCKIMRDVLLILQWSEQSKSKGRQCEDRLVPVLSPATTTAAMKRLWRRRPVLIQKQYQTEMKPLSLWGEDDCSDMRRRIRS